MDDYNIFEIGYDIDVGLLSSSNKYIIKDPWFRVKRTSISEAIFESTLARKAGCDMINGNTYILITPDSTDFMFIHCMDEYIYFGASLVENE